MDSKSVTLNPTLNGGEGKSDLLACGCDPENAKTDSEGRRMVFLIKRNEGFFLPLGFKMGMQISLCAQCKEVMGFQAVAPTIASRPLIVPG